MRTALPVQYNNDLKLVAANHLLGRNPSLVGQNAHVSEMEVRESFSLIEPDKSHSKRMTKVLLTDLTLNSEYTSLRMFRDSNSSKISYKVIWIAHMHSFLEFGVHELMLLD